jgi:nitrous oxidase accessory protein
VGRRTDTVFDGNYWSENHEPDLDGDGRSDRPYRLTSVFDHFRGNLTAADLMSQGFGATALAVAEETFPVLQAIPVEDKAPLVRPPVLAAVPSVEMKRRAVNKGGLVSAFGALTVGIVVLLRGRR